MDKISTIRTLALLDHNKRELLDLLESEKTFEEISSNFNDLTNIQIQNYLDVLKKIGLVKDSRKFMKKQKKDALLKKYVRTF